MSEMYQLTLRDYVSMVRRRGWISAAIFSIVLTTGLVITMLIPPVFQSTGTIVIESQQVPVDLVQATVTSFADERIEVIKQRVMTRENLLQIIEKYSLFKSPEFEGSKITPSEMIDQMRRQIQVILVNANVQNRGSKGTSGTIAFKVVVENRHPELAQRVANELVTLFLDANVKVRTERASQTTVFLTQEATKLKTDLEALEAQIAGYKSENGAALPENVAVNTNSIERMESDLRALEAESRSANEELRALELELSGAKAGVGAGGTNQARSPEEELRVAKSELSLVHRQSPRCARSAPQSRSLGAQRAPNLVVWLRHPEYRRHASGAHRKQDLFRPRPHQADLSATKHHQKPHEHRRAAIAQGTPGRTGPVGPHA